MKHTPDKQHDQELAPLDEFESQWVSLLKQTDADTLADAEAFTQGVMQRVERERGWAVLAKIGFWQPVAVAATIAVAASAVWFIQQHQTEPTEPSAKAPAAHFADTPKQDHESQEQVAVAQASPDTAKVGQIIGNFSRSLNRPAASEPASPPAQVQRVIDLFDQPLGNPTDLLPQRSTTDRG